MNNNVLSLYGSLYRNFPAQVKAQNAKELDFARSRIEKAQFWNKKRADRVDHKERFRAQFLQSHPEFLRYIELVEADSRVSGFAEPVLSGFQIAQAMSREALARGLREYRSNGGGAAGHAFAIRRQVKAAKERLRENRFCDALEWAENGPQSENWDLWRAVVGCRSRNRRISDQSRFFIADAYEKHLLDQEKWASLGDTFGPCLSDAVFIHFQDRKAASNENARRNKIKRDSLIRAHAKPLKGPRAARALDTNRGTPTPPQETPENSQFSYGGFEADKARKEMMKGAKSSPVVHPVRQVTRFALHNTASRLVMKHGSNVSIPKCGRAIQGKEDSDFVSLERRASSDEKAPDYVAPTNVGYCKSRNCPRCAPMIALNVRDKINYRIDGIVKRGARLGFLTLTVSHDNSIPLAAEVALMTEAYARLGDGKMMKSAKNRGFLGMDRIFEVTYGADSGWHLHIHALMYFDPAQGFDLKDDGAKIINRWISLIQKRGWKAGIAGQDIREVDLSKNEQNGQIGDVLSKYGMKSLTSWGIDLELAGSAFKEGKRPSRYSVTQLLAFAHHGDEECGARYAEACKALKGIKVFSPSRCVTQLVGTKNDEKPDETAENGEEIAEEIEIEAQADPVIGQIPSVVWNAEHAIGNIYPIMKSIQHHVIDEKRGFDEALPLIWADVATDQLESMCKQGSRGELSKNRTMQTIREKFARIGDGEVQTEHVPIASKAVKIAYRHTVIMPLTGEILDFAEIDLQNGAGRFFFPVDPGYDFAAVWSSSFV
ncbi:protein rep [Komagataeibacter sp. FNDCF1]|uniref:protein rep n=1 Tax=Komagataeibacter sp. FNDCF1 TaxID=2878681 RepID=UPI001E4A308D|nr:protein rep [Komagataeibacter sp. FNDCF1]